MPDTALRVTYCETRSQHGASRLVSTSAIMLLEKDELGRLDRCTFGRRSLAGLRRYGAFCIPRAAVSHSGRPPNTTTPAVAPTPAATSNTKSAPATYARYLSGAIHPSSTPAPAG